MQSEKSTDDKNENVRNGCNIRQATLEDVQMIEEIFRDVINWMKKYHLENTWNDKNTSWEELSKSYKISDFYLYCVDAEPIGCVAITDEDKSFWPELKSGESLFLHKLAVKRKFAGHQISSSLITYVKEMAEKKRVCSVRLDCNSNRVKLRELYENNGFEHCRDIKTQTGYQLSLYKAQIL